MIRWPARALDAIQKLFEPLQDVDIFVEDAEDEVFYPESCDVGAPEPR